MAYQSFPGETPEILTVSASPTPTASGFSVNDAGNLLQGQWITVKRGSDYERTKITGIVGNALTVSPPLTGAPDTPGEARNSRQLIAISHIQGAGVFNADEPADLEDVNGLYAPNSLKYLVPERGLYRFSPGDTSPADGEEVVYNPNGRFIRELSPGGDGSNLANLVHSLLLRVQALETAQFVMGTTPASVHSCAEDLVSVSATAATVTRIPLPLRNAVGFTAKAGDMALVQLSEGYRYAVSVSAVVNKDNVLMLHITNPTASAIAMLSQKVVVTIIKQGAAVYGITKN